MPYSGVCGICNLKKKDTTLWGGVNTLEQAKVDSRITRRTWLALSVGGGVWKWSVALTRKQECVSVCTRGLKGFKGAKEGGWGGPGRRSWCNLWPFGTLHSLPEATSKCTLHASPSCHRKKKEKGERANEQGGRVSADIAVTELRVHSKLITKQARCTFLCARYHALMHTHLPCTKSQYNVSLFHVYAQIFQDFISTFLLSKKNFLIIVLYTFPQNWVRQKLFVFNSLVQASDLHIILYIRSLYV